MAGQPLPPAATPPLLRVEELFSNPAAVDAVVSPDGQWIASLRPRQGRLDIYLSPAASGPGRWATRATSHPIENVRWSVDGRRILYRQDQGGDEGYHLFAADLGTAGPSSPRDLTPFPGTETELIAAPVATPNTVLITLNRRNPALADAVRLHLDTGVLEVAAENPGTFLGYLADGRNQVRVAYSLDSAGRYSLHARSSDREPWHVVRTFPVEDKITPLRLHPDGLRIYALSNADVDLTQLVLIDLTTGAETVVDSDPERQVDLETVLFDEESGEVIASRYAADTIRWYARSPVVTRLLHRLAAAGLTPSEIGPSDRPGTKWVVHVDSPTDPGAGYLYDDARGTLRRLYRSRRGLDPAHLAPTPRDHFGRLRSTAMPWPPPMHADATAYVPPRAASSRATV